MQAVWAGRSLARRRAAPCQRTSCLCRRSAPTSPRRRRRPTPARAPPAHLRLAVGASIPKVGQHGGDGAGRGALAGVNHDEQFHHVVVDGGRGGLDEEDVAAADRLAHLRRGRVWWVTRGRWMHAGGWKRAWHARLLCMHGRMHEALQPLQPRLRARLACKRPQHKQHKRVLRMYTHAFAPTQRFSLGPCYHRHSHAHTAAGPRPPARRSRRLQTA